MGEWGVGNFEGDSARDFLADLVAVWERIIEHAMAGRMNELTAYFGPDATPINETPLEAVDHIVMPTIEVLIAVAEKHPCDYLPDPETVVTWSAEALRIFDTDGPIAWDEPEERRLVIEETFQRLLRIVRREASGERE